MSDFLFEVQRLKTLYSYDLLDSLAEQAYDDIVAMAAHVCHSPIAFISLIDKDRCWLKAKKGISAIEFPRHNYLTSIIDAPDEVFIFENVQNKPHLFEHLKLEQNQTIQFYASKALVSPEGDVLGTLSVMDYKHRSLDETQHDFLKKLAHQVMAQLEWHKSRKEVQQLKKSLNETRQELDAFTYSVSHDLKAPLRGIKGFSELIVEDYLHELNDDAKDLFEQVIISANKLEAFLNNLLVLSRVSRKEIVSAPLNLSEISKKVLQKMQLSDQYSIKIEENLMSAGDAHLIEIALEQLIENAIKFSKKEEEARIEIGQQTDNNTSVFYIKDNGVGFDMNYAGAIFEPFQRLHGDYDFDGTGIGLAIVHRIINRHHRKIWLQSKPNEGATFYFMM